MLNNTESLKEREEERNRERGSYFVDIPDSLTISRGEYASFTKDLHFFFNYRKN